MVAARSYVGATLIELYLGEVMLVHVSISAVGKMKPVSRREYDRMGSSEKKEYAKQFPSSTHLEASEGERSVTGKFIKNIDEVRESNDAKETQKASKEAEQKAAKKAAKKPFSAKETAAAVVRNLKMVPKLANAFVKARDTIRNDPKLEKAIKEDNKVAIGAIGASTAVAVAGGVAGALKGAKLALSLKSMLVNTAVFKGTVLGGVKAGAAGMAAAGAAPGILLGVIVAGLWIHSKVKRHKAVMKKHMKSESSGFSAEQLQKDLESGLRLIEKNGLEPWQRDLLNEHYKAKA